LIRRPGDVLTHRVDEESGFFDRVARLQLTALEAHERIPREMRQQQHRDD
jgi:hypothetical protein